MQRRAEAGVALGNTQGRTEPPSLPLAHTPAGTQPPPVRSRGRMAKGDVYSKFLDFLRSPMWALPVMGFIEQRSIGKAFKSRTKSEPAMPCHRCSVRQGDGGREALWPDSRRVQGPGKTAPQPSDAGRMLGVAQVDMLIGCFCEDTGIKPAQITQEIAKDAKAAAARPDVEMVQPFQLTQLSS